MHITRNGMVALAVFSFAAVTLPIAVGQLDQKKESARFVGVWRIVKNRANGTDTPAEALGALRLTFSNDGKVVFTVLDEKAKEGTFKVVGAGHLDIALDGREDRSLGIFKFGDDGRLTLCLRRKPGEGKRPTEFSADRDQQQDILVLERARAGEEKPTGEEIAKFKVVTDKIRQAAARATSVNNLRQIGLAFHSYHLAHKQMPLHAIYSKDGKTPLLSWRVAILHDIEEGPLYKQFKLDEPWDSEHNKKLIPLMPKIYESLGSGKKHEGHTYYQAFADRSTVFDGAKKITLAQITNANGTSNTIAVVEARNSVVWTKPEDLKMPAAGDKVLPVGGLFEDCWHALFCDGDVRTFGNDMPVATLRAAITPFGNALHDFEKYEKK
jgi:uncharacterized protein (TIGR03067 family)